MRTHFYPPHGFIMCLTKRRNNLDLGPSFLCQIMSTSSVINWDHHHHHHHLPFSASAEYLFWFVRSWNHRVDVWIKLYHVIWQLHLSVKHTELPANVDFYVFKGRARRKNTMGTHNSSCSNTVKTWGESLAGPSCSAVPKEKKNGSTIL